MTREEEDAEFASWFRYRYSLIRERLGAQRHLKLLVAGAYRDLGLRRDADD